MNWMLLNLLIGFNAHKEFNYLILEDKVNKLADQLEILEKNYNELNGMIV